MYMIVSAPTRFLSLREKQTAMASNDQKQERNHRHLVCLGFTWRALMVCRKKS